VYPNNKSCLFKSLFLAAAIFGSPGAFAGNTDTGVLDQCEKLPLVLNLAPFSTTYGDANNSVCVDVPVALKEVHVVFNLDTNTVDGNHVSVGLKHMFMLGTAIKDRIDRGLVNPSNVSIIGVLHGTAAKWATNDSLTHATSEYIATQRFWINRIMALKNAGVNLQLEICGVTMRGNSWTNDNLYTPVDSQSNPIGKIYVNQGAIGRIIDLQQQKYVYIHEGYEDWDAN